MKWSALPSLTIIYDPSRLTDNSASLFTGEELYFQMKQKKDGTFRCTYSQRKVNLLANSDTDILKDWLQDTPAFALHHVLTQKSKFLSILNTDLDLVATTLILNLNEHICLAGLQPSNRRAFFDCFVGTRFIKHIDNLALPTLRRFLFLYVQECSPENVLKQDNDVEVLLQELAKQSVRKKCMAGAAATQGTEDLIQQMTTWIHAKRTGKPLLMLPQENQQVRMEVAREDFQVLELFPTLAELQDLSRFTASNLPVLQTEYTDLAQCINHNFLLYRSSFFRWIAEGVAYVHQHGLTCVNQVRAMPNGTQKKKDYFLYFNVQYAHKVAVQFVEYFCLQFDRHQLDLIKVHWETTKRLKSGNLICFSNDGFRSQVYWGQVRFPQTPRTASEPLASTCVG